MTTAAIEPMYVRIDTVLPSVLFHASPVAFRMPDNGSGDSVKVGPLRVDFFPSPGASSAEPGSGAAVLFSSLTIDPHSRKAIFDRKQSRTQSDSISTVALLADSGYAA